MSATPTPSKDAPEVIDLLGDSQATTKSVASSVLFEEDDFSDDLDLDFEAPAALPSLPATAVNKTASRIDEFPRRQIHQRRIVVFLSASHFVRPQAQPEAMFKTSTKRESPDDKPQAAAEPAAKKRALPTQWSQNKSAEASSIEELYHDAVTPAPKASRQLPWNTTASGVKAQKKQLKDQQRATGPGKDDYAMDEIQRSCILDPCRRQELPSATSSGMVKDLVVEKGKSVFFTGPAGTGKSVLMRAIIQDLKKKHARDPERVAVTASTGLAACNIGGMTLHSFAGIGLGKEGRPSPRQRRFGGIPRPRTDGSRRKRSSLMRCRWLMASSLTNSHESEAKFATTAGRGVGSSSVITGDFFQLAAGAGEA